MKLERKDIRALLPIRPEDGHKGTFGHLFVIAGSRGFTGAARLVCEAAGRSGVGLVSLGIPHPLGDIAATVLLEAMTLRLPATEAETLAHDAIEPALAFAADKQAVALGPGLSRNDETVSFVLDFAVACPVPIVIDADALNALSEHPGVLHDRHAPCILTPHPGEMARLLGSSTSEVQADREGAALGLARDLGTVVALKGRGTVIAAPDGRTATNTSGNAGMGTGGTGDVLTGILGALLAQGMDAYEAACIGVYLHGLAGDLAAERMTQRGMVARDLIDTLPGAWRTLESS